MINSFMGEYRFLSNFFPCKITWEGIEYPSTEHAYQAAKSLDYQTRQQVALCPTPGKAKRMGSKIDIRPDWESVKVGIMMDILRLKFEHPELRQLLNKTKPHELIEGNTWGDTFWGVCNGVGENWLGKLLMERRDS